MTADLDRRLYAFLLDRLVCWSLDSVAVALAVAWFFRDGRWLAGGLTIVVAAGLVAIGFAVVLGRWGVSPGKAALGMRVVSSYDGLPIGVRAALLRTTVLDLAVLPTFGLGVAGLAWTALVDPAGRRRGWHDLWVGSWVVDVRPAPPAPVEVPEPMPMVNLTTARLLSPQ